MMAQGLGWNDPLRGAQSAEGAKVGHGWGGGGQVFLLYMHIWTPYAILGE